MIRLPHTLYKLTLIALLSLGLMACQSAYYSAMESVGMHKRDILTSRIEGVRDAQVDAKEQFRDALDRFSQELGYNGGELQSVYENLHDAYEDSQQEADNVSRRIDEVEDVAEALFAEWEDELEQYSSASLRRESQSQLRDTRKQYKNMLVTMRSAESKMAPVLKTFNDQVLYLKHNLNARAIGSLKAEFGGLRRDINTLIARMEESIAESDKFIKNLK
ncbi:DUF2959 domain-containing protein [uncultured Pseudoteredinibacter sp.]|uniref:DUF2959 domain-containing protein n=1 Tax=uncultured Pseudoteredinibacter sp. TaxID=1641701 RepID=UPI00261A03A3|nr:DUF2959 domain-containing protein [uncultured Pseudoteredinibacter sp.]